MIATFNVIFGISKKTHPALFLQKVNNIKKPP